MDDIAELSGNRTDPSFADGYHTLCYQVMDATEVKSVLQNAADEFLDNSQQLG